MRRVIVISYTEKGRALNCRVSEYLAQHGDVPVSFHHRKDFMSTDELLRQEWERSSAFVFIGAMGIAVRHIACYLKDKMRDPAVLVVDERGQFVIPVLSGHIGGGVALTREMAQRLGAQPVITTATDVEERFAVDVFACDNHLRIENREQVKKISAALLQGQCVNLWSGLPLAGEMPVGVHLCSGGQKPPGACVLKPARYILGIGCKKGKAADELEAFLDEVCARKGMDKGEIAAIASVDRKREESGIWELSRRLGVPFEVFTPEKLAQVEEEVTASAFVRQTLGVDNVCERSAYCLAKEWTGEGKTQGAHCFRVCWEQAEYRLMTGKQTGAGMTLAVVELVWKHADAKIDIERQGGELC